MNDPNNLGYLALGLLVFTIIIRWMKKDKDI